MIDVNGAAAAGKRIRFTVSDADKFGRRTVVLLIGDQEIHRDLFNPDSKAACDNFAAAVAGNAPHGLVDWAVREHLDLPDDRFATEMAEPFAQWVRDGISKRIARGQEASADDQSEFAVYTLADLAKADLSVNYIVEGLLVERQPMVLAGPRKALKTSLSVELCYCLATGRDFLGHFRIPEPRRTAFFTGESGLAVVYETFHRVAGDDSDRLADLGDSIIISEHVPQMADPSSLQKMARTAKAHRSDVVIVDPTYMAMPAGDSGNLFAQGALLKAISETCLEIGATLILSHHTRKGVADPFAPAELDDIAWAGFQEFARQWILTSRRAKYEPGTGEHRLWLSAGGSAGHSGLWALDVSEGRYEPGVPRRWRRLLMSADDARGQVRDDRDAARETDRAAKLDRDVKALVDAAAKFRDGETKSVIRDRAGLSGGRCNAALPVALERGFVVACQIVKGNKTTPLEGYKLATDTAQP